MYHDLDDATLVMFGGYAPAAPSGHGSEAPLGGWEEKTLLNGHWLQPSPFAHN